MRFCRYLSLITVVLIINGCAMKPSPRDPSAVVWDSNSDQWVTPEAMTDKLTNVQYVVIGELYQSLSMRDQLLNALDDLKHDGWLKVLAIDVLSPEVAAEGKNYMQQLDSAPPVLADRYRPFVIWANQQDDVVLLGTATPKGKLASMKNPEGQQWLSEQTQGVLSERKQKELQKILTESHPSKAKNESAGQYLLAAQKLNDYFMARMVTATKQNSVLLTRAFHARKDLGVQPYIQKIEPSAKIISVLMLGSLDDQKLPDHLFDELKQHYDYVWLQKPENNLMLAPKSHDSLQNQDSPQLEQ